MPTASLESVVMEAEQKTRMLVKMETGSWNWKRRRKLLITPERPPFDMIRPKLADAPSGWERG